MGDFETQEAAAALELLSNAMINRNEEIQNCASYPDFSLNEESYPLDPTSINSTTKLDHRK